MSLVASIGTPTTSSSSVTVAKAIWPSLETWASLPASNGDATDATCGILPTALSTVSTRALVCGSVILPSLTATTSCSWSPEAFGADFCSRFRASKLSVPLSLNSSL